MKILLTAAILTLLFPALTVEDNHAVTRSGFQAEDPPDPDQLIDAFVAKETAFRDLWNQYTYTQTIIFEELGVDREVLGRVEVEVEVYFTTKGERRTRKKKHQGKLKNIFVTVQDVENAIRLQPFVLTEDDRHDYRIDYVGAERVDELDTHVFELSPRKIRDLRHYFKGRIWVDQEDMQIVMTRGTIVPQTRNSRYPEFETLRQQIDGTHWFPVWTEADDVLDFPGHAAHIYQLITYKNFKKFEVKSTLSFPDNP